MRTGLVIAMLQKHKTEQYGSAKTVNTLFYDSCINHTVLQNDRLIITNSIAAIVRERQQQTCSKCGQLRTKRCNNIRGHCNIKMVKIIAKDYFH